MLLGFFGGQCASEDGWRSSAPKLQIRVTSHSLLLVAKVSLNESSLSERRGGKLISCLTSKLDEIQSKECKQEVRAG